MQLAKILMSVGVSLALIFVSSANAVEAPELPDDLKVFPLAKVDRLKQEGVVDYRFVLGSVVKIDRRVRTDSELRLSGKLDQISWEIPGYHQPEEAFSYFRSQLVEKGGQLLYECKGRECGASNIWSNDIFSNSTLYGRDESQRYLAALLNGNHYAIYAVRRGNQRVYFHMDLLRSDRDSEQAWNTPLESQGYAVLPHWPESPDLAAQSLAEWMRTHSGNIRLVIHQAGLDVKLSQSKAQHLADLLKGRVSEEGVDANRIEAYGLGPIVPSVLGAKEQVAEVIWIQE